MIKAVLFDFGGVLTEGGKAGGIPGTIARLCGRRPEEILLNDVHQQFIRGQITATEFFDEVNRRYPCADPITASSFVASSNIYSRCEQVYALAAELRKHGIKTGVLSNMYSMSAEKLKAEGFYDDFDPVIVSSGVHMAKPEPAFFELALSKLSLLSSEVLFIEDQARYMPPEDLGLHTILATSPQQIVDDTKALLLKENNLRLE